MGYILRFLALGLAASIAIGLVRHDDGRASLRETDRVFGGMVGGMAALGLLVHMASLF